MSFSREDLIKELMWEYNYDEAEASTIVDSYINHGQYYSLIEKLSKHISERITEYKE